MYTSEPGKHNPPTSRAGACANTVSFLPAILTSATYGDLIVALGRLISVPLINRPSVSNGGILLYEDTEDDEIEDFLLFDCSLVGVVILFDCSLIGVVIDVVSLIPLSKPALIRVDRRLLDDPRLLLLVDIDIVVIGYDNRNSSAVMLLDSRRIYAVLAAHASRS